MQDLEIPVTYKSQQLRFKAHVVRVGYVNHIAADLNGIQITSREMKKAIIER